MQSLQFLKVATLSTALAVVWSPSCPLSKPVKIFLTVMGAVVTVGPNTIYRTYEKIKTTIAHGLEIQKWSWYYDEYTLMQALQTVATRGPTAARQHSRDVQPAAIEIIKDVFAEVPKQPILELGSDILNENGQSYMAELLPEGYQQDLTYSDCKASRVASESKKTARTYRQLDATTLDGIEDGSLTTVVALNVFDTIDRDKLHNAASALLRTLKPKGRAVILADLPFHENPFLKKYAIEGTVLIPHMTENFLGAKRVLKETLLDHTKQNDSQLYPFLEMICEKSPLEIAKFLFNTFQYGERLCPLLASICPEECYELFDHRTSYPEDLQEAFKEFTILEHQYRKKTVRVDGRIEAQPPANSLTSDVRHVGVVLPTQNNDIPEGQIELSCVFHVLIAQKN